MGKFRSMILFLIGLALSMIGFGAHAAALDLSSLTTAVDFSSVTTAVLAVAASLMVVYIAWKASGLVIAAVRRL